MADSGVVFHIVPGVKQTRITFHSDAPLEDFKGTTSQVTGHFVFDPLQPRRGGNGVISTPVASLNTGIPLRDEHLRSEDWLDAAQFPDIVLRVLAIDSIRVADSAADFTTYDVVAACSLSVHGVVRAVSLSARATHLRESEKTRKVLPGDWLAVRAEFMIALADFGITGPARTDIVGSRVSDSVFVEVSILSATVTPTGTGPR
ncbi:MAG: YceI family protein [Candidatus Zixiibacteriota bacterium]